MLIQNLVFCVSIRVIFILMATSVKQTANDFATLRYSLRKKNR